MRGIFLCLEGIDGCGKSTQAKLLAEWLTSRNKEVVLTAEPTRGPIGKLIREILRGKIACTPLAEAFLFAADRSWHLENVIKPALRQGKIVVCERYISSSLAYQPARGVPERIVREINRHFPRPDLEILIDVPPELCLRRLRKSLDNFERDYSLQERVRKNYLRLFKRNHQPIVDGSGSANEVAEEIRKIIMREILGTS